MAVAVSRSREFDPLRVAAPSVSSATSLSSLGGGPKGPAIGRNWTPGSGAPPPFIAGSSSTSVAPTDADGEPQRAVSYVAGAGMPLMANASRFAVDRDEFARTSAFPGSTGKKGSGTVLASSSSSSFREPEVELEYPEPNGPRAIYDPKAVASSVLKKKEAADAAAAAAASKRATGGGAKKSVVIDAASVSHPAGDAPPVTASPLMPQAAAAVVAAGAPVDGSASSSPLTAARQGGSGGGSGRSSKRVVVFSD